MEEYKADVRHHFPQLLIALLETISNFLYDQEFLKGAKELLHLLLGTTGEQPEMAIVDQLFRRLSESDAGYGTLPWWKTSPLLSTTKMLPECHKKKQPSAAR
ncbi:Hypothetical predicted protein [Podarcis lilfordi]|uniref:Uncharacterized protein n=1 Tax=Podarcis lilfordi TaxID=74358 RepID=A0AA35L5X3_9SAUR|nr:Hypothetical predicted protein [Podarcis lilfordi]